MKEPSLQQIHLSKVSESNFESLTTGKDESFEALKAHIGQEGILQTLLVREGEEGFEVIDGNRRLKAAQELEIEVIPCAIVECRDREALALSIAMNRLKGELNGDVAPKIFLDLKNEGVKHEEIEKIFPEKMHNQVGRLLDKVRLANKEPPETPNTSIDEEDKADLEEHATTGPHHKQFRFEKEEHRDELTEIVKEQRNEGDSVGFTVLRLLRSLDSSKTRTHVKVKEE